MDGWVTLPSSPLCSPQSSVMVRHPFSFLLYNVLWSWCDVYFLPRLYTRWSLCWSVTLNNLLSLFIANSSNSSGSCGGSYSSFPAFIMFSHAHMLLTLLLFVLCVCRCVYVVAHHVICLHELCISYYLQLFNSSKLSWCLTASFYPPVFKVNCDTSQPNGREIRRLKVSALLSVDR